MAASAVNTPYTTYRFRVGFGNLGQFMAARVSGLEVDSDTIEYREGGDSAQVIQKLPGLMNAGEVTIERVALESDSVSFHDAIKAQFGNTTGSIGSSAVAKTAVTVTSIKADGSDGQQWTLNGVTVKGFKLSDLDAQESEVLYESLVLNVESIDRG